MAVIQEFTTAYKRNLTKWCYSRVKKKFGKKFKKNKFDTGKAQRMFLEFIDKFNEIIERMNEFKTEDEIKDIIEDYDYATQNQLDSHEDNQMAHSSGQPSDRRLKYDVAFVGKSPSGINIYNFRFKDKNKYGKGLYQGVMSDEVPESVVVKDSNGYDVVNYGQIDVDFVAINKL